ncbi:hypothetical protein [Bremerella cremea]|uniref:hypothetical protein n=1 Tax=Bremerella cremea TaxID=1031537 RepID=UPI0031E6BF35
MKRKRKTRTAAKPTPRPSRKKIAATREAAGQLCRRLEILLRQGALAESLEAHKEFIRQLENPQVRWSEYRYLRDVPLAITDMDPRCRELLEVAGYLTVGNIDQASDAELCSLQGISRRRLIRIRADVETIAKHYVAWRLEQDQRDLAK